MNITPSRIALFGNLKMELPTRGQNKQLAATITQHIGMKNSVVKEMPEIALFPSSPHLYTVADIFSNSNRYTRRDLGAGAQNISHSMTRANVDEVSPDTLKDAGAEWAIVGHSTTRADRNESDELVAKRLVNGLREGIKMVPCIGEKLEERDAGKTQEVLGRQLSAFFTAIKEADLTPKQIIDGFKKLAYEPVWAIGEKAAARGLKCDPKDAKEAIDFVKGQVAQNLGDSVADKVGFLYGGGSNAKNMQSYLEAGQGNVNGFLIGGAAKSPDTFLPMIDKAHEMMNR